MRQVRSLLRSHWLPKPSHLWLSTRTRTASLGFTTGPAADRLTAVLLWSMRLDGVTITWKHTIPGELTVTMTGRTSSGIAINTGTTAGVAELGGRLRNRTVAEVARSFRLDLDAAETLTVEELCKLIRAARDTGTGRGMNGAAA
ncbi:hypothetical protein [Crossiella sp. CA198]|uniref:hypothetical protein n=1 Tax=Crossiella sp. CA198 TaxID=3455607 RepID=UPI003F8D05EA